MRSLILRLVVFVFLFVGGFYSQPGSTLWAAERIDEVPFHSDIAPGAVPWTHLGFANNPGNFHFAIVSDRCGGHRLGVFETALARLNLLQPEFVICVGDLIEGYTTKPEDLDAMWSEFDGFTKRLTMPFFHVAGNHDVSNAFMRKYYEKKFGQTYFHFVYKNVLFLCLNSQDGYDEGGGYLTAISKDQREYVRHVLEKNKGVRWTFVFMHQPLWLNEEGNFETARKKGTVPETTGFSELQKMLAGRDFTLFTGHFHDYAKYERNGKAYYVLATTGGASSLRGPFYGELDEIVWMTMTDTGPVMANLSLNGILPDNFRTETDIKTSNSVLAQLSNFTLKLERNATRPPEEMRWQFENPYQQEAQFRVKWTLPAGSPWSIEPLETSFSVPAGKAYSAAWTLRCPGSTANPATLEPYPTGVVTAAFADGSTLVERLPVKLSVDTWPYAEKRQELKKAVRLDRLDPVAAPFASKFTVEQANILDEPVVTTISWQGPEGSGWTVSPAAAELKLDAQAKGCHEFTASFNGNAPIWKLPVMNLETRAGAAPVLLLKKLLPANIETYMAALPIQLKVKKAAGAPAIDGKLDDALWASSAKITEFCLCETGEAATSLTTAWISYDADCLYIAVRCAEPKMNRLSLKAKKRDDGLLWRDDGIEVFIDPTFDREHYFQLCVNANNVVFDAKGKDVSWDCAMETATGREQEAYTVELAVPWVALGVPGGPQPGAAMGFNILRNRYTEKEDYYQWSPTLGSSHKPKLFGKLIFE